MYYGKSIKKSLVTKYYDYDIVYGGGEKGLMGVVANTAIKNNAHVTGIIPEFLDNRETIHNRRYNYR